MGDHIVVPGNPPVPTTPGPEELKLLQMSVLCVPPKVNSWNGRLNCAFAVTGKNAANDKTIDAITPFDFIADNMVNNLRHLQAFRFLVLVLHILRIALCCCR